MVSEDEDLWSIEQPSIREATLHETESNFVVDDLEYEEKRDGKITSTRNVLLIDLDL